MSSVAETETTSETTSTETTSETTSEAAQESQRQLTTRQLQALALGRAKRQANLVARRGGGPLIQARVYGPEDTADIFKFLDTLEVEYHKPYKRFNQIVKVPRGQASYTVDDSIHYDYKVSGGSPPNYVMCDRLKAITAATNAVLGTEFNTILLNKYINGDDCIGFHKDKEVGWAEGTGFATLAFGVTRDFQIRHVESNVTTTVPHEDGCVLHMPYPMNHHYMHSVPKRKAVTGCRISLTFRHITTRKSDVAAKKTGA